MATITLNLPDTTPLASLRAWAESIGCELQRRPDGTYTARPRGGAQTNANRIKRPRHKGQIMHARVPEAPEDIR